MMHLKKTAGLMLVALSSCVQLRGESLQEAIAAGADLTGKNIRIGVTKAFPEVPTVTNGAQQVGFGDCFQYMLYAEYLKDQGANVAIDLPNRLKAFFAKTTNLVQSDKVDTKNYEEFQLADAFQTLNCKVPNFERSEPFLKCPNDVVLKWDKELKKRINGSQIPVIFFTQGAPHHPERFPTEAEWNEFTKDMPNAVFFNAQFQGPDIKNSTRPSAIDASFDKAVPFLDTLGIVVAAIVLNKGFGVSPDTGSLHLCAAGVEGKKEAVNRVLGVLAKKPDQRWRLFNYMKTIKEKEGVKINKCVWYPESTLLFQQTKGDFIPVINAMKEHIKKATPGTGSLL